MGRWSWNNLSTLGLSFMLALLVWVIAVNEENPTEERLFSRPLAIELLNLPPDLILVGPVTAEATVTIRAPRSVWETLIADQIRVSADLAGQTAGAHDIPLQWRLDPLAARVTKLNPASIRVTLERRATREQPIAIEAVGEPATGYEAGAISLAVTTATVTGPASAVDRVGKIVAALSLAGRKSDFDEDLALVPEDSAGKPLSGVTVTPATVRVTVPITQKAGFRDVAVKVVTQGQVAAGFRITNITVAPPVITVSSADPNKVSELPGFVETQPLDISNASDDIVQRLALALTEGVTPVGEQSVLVQINIAAIESSLTVQRKLEIQGLGPGLTATPSPDTVDVLLSGPLPVLDQLKLEDVRVILDLTGLGRGTHQVTPQVILLSDRLRAENVLPSQIEVVITVGPTPTPSRP